MQVLVIRTDADNAHFVDVYEYPGTLDVVLANIGAAINTDGVRRIEIIVAQAREDEMSRAARTVEFEPETSRDMLGNH